MFPEENEDTVLKEAKKFEKKYRWAEALELYKEALGSVGKDGLLRKGEIQEKIGHCFQRVAFQAETPKEFKRGIRRAIEAYQKAKEFYEKLTERREDARIYRCDALVSYVDYWLTSEAPEKRKLLGKCWSLTKEALKAFREAGDAWEYGRTFNQLSSSVLFRFCLEWNFQAREETIGEAIEHGEQAIKILSTFGDTHELARAYARNAFCLGVFDYYFLDIGEKGRENQKAQSYWLKASELSEEIALLELLYPVFGGKLSIGWGEGTNETLLKLEKALKYARRTKDKLLIGLALDWLTYHTAWSGAAIESKDEIEKLRKTVLKYIEDARNQYSVISFTSPRADNAWIEKDVDFSIFFGLDFETDVNKKRDLLEKALRCMSDSSRVADASGYPEVTLYVNHILVDVLKSLAKIEPNSKKKKEFLEKALENGNEAIRLTEQFQPFLYWNRGIIQLHLAETKHELVELAAKLEIKRKLLQEALSDLKNCLKLLLKGITLYRKSSVMPFTSLGNVQYQYGNWLGSLYEYTNNRKHLKEAIETFEDAAESFQKTNLKTRVAECNWKTAHAYDTLTEYLKAAENFDRASHNYENAAEKIPQLRLFYQDHALYMRSWCEIEKARHHHAEKNFDRAKEHYEKATGLHESTERWSYLSQNYLAWARLEEAEDLSRREKTEEAKDLFQQAVSLFADAKMAIKAKLDQIEAKDEKQMCIRLIKASDMRRDYCLGRAALEEAKTLDRQGNYTVSSRKYRSAAEMFEKIAGTESEQRREEMQLLIRLCQAWEKMMIAEAKTSPAMYGEAADLFKEAKEYALDQRTSLLALANSSFCKALEAGTKFEETKDRTLHMAATRHLETAANYYVKAGFETASEYSRATQCLFDAYLYMDNAKKETDLEKKARYYIMAEKVLQTSAGSFLKARHPEKREQVQRLLKKVKEERELAVSLSEVLHAPSVTSTTSSFVTPTSSEEKAVGLERFEHADIQANLSARRKEVKVGEDVDLEIELANVGKAPALLMKVEEIIPKDFDIKGVPNVYRVEGSRLNLKGKKLDPMKTEEIKIVARPRSRGTFKMTPQVFYTDETGKYKLHRPAPLTITVKELGIKGWIKG